MKMIILTVHILVALSIIGLILLQNSKGGLQGGLTGGEFYRSKRGAERLVFTGTIVLVTLFLVTSVLNMVIH